MLDDIDNLLDDAIAAHKAKDFSRAMSKYNEILENDAHHADANYNFGLLTEEIGLKNEALIFFQSALKTNPNQLQYWEAFVKILIEVEKFGEAKTALKQAQTAGHPVEKLDHLIKEAEFKQKESRIEPQANFKRENRPAVRGGNFTPLEQKLCLSAKSNQHGQKINTNKSNILDNLKLDKALKLAAKNIREIGRAHV